MKHKNIIDQMTMEEKAAFLSGRNEWQTREIPRLHIPSILLSDGPHGIRKQEGTGDHLGLNPSLPATCFPTAATVANSWNEELGEEIGKALGEEAAALGVDVLLGPGLNIKRSPLCGRNFEYFSEEPCLAGKMAAAYIRGIQSRGVFACPKHFAVNSQELRRMAMNAVLDERTLRELYLTGFEIAVKEGRPGAIMTSYNEVNGTYANENTHLLKEILRDDWGFEGFVVTDWGGSNDHVKGVKAGSDLEMPTPGLDSARQILKAIDENRLSVQELDARVDCLLDAALTLSAGKKTESKSDEARHQELARKAASRSVGYEAEHHELARKAAAESIVLLKNDQNMLPLASGANVAVVGDFAYEPRYQGAGSSMVNSTWVESFREKLKEYDLSVAGICRGYRRDGKPDAALKKEALELAEKADIVLYCFGLDELSESEGLDRTHMKIHENQIELLAAMREKNENIAGLLSAGAAIEMPWRENLKALLHGYLYGQAGAGAALDNLTGKVNPSGKLAESYPEKYQDTPAYSFFPGRMRNSEYRESIYVGYRYYQTAGIQTAYPFGYGLSYTDFAYSDLHVDQAGAAFTVTNTGERDGAEIAQLYIGLPDAEVFRPRKELKGFRKVFLKAGESRKIMIPFDDKTFRYWDRNRNGWETEGGEYQIMIGADSEDIRLASGFFVEGTVNCCPYQKEKLPSYYSGNIQKVEAQEFAELLGGLPSFGEWKGLLGLNDSVSQMYYAKSRLARLAYRVLTGMKKRSEKKGVPDLNILFLYHMPFRAMAKMSGGLVSMDMAEGIVTLVNGNFIRGIRKIIGGFFQNKKANKEYERLLKEGKTNDPAARRDEE